MEFSFNKAWVLGVILCLLSLAACKESATPDQTKSTLRRLEVGGREFYIPKGYFSEGYTGAAPNSILIQAWYPGDKIVPGNSTELWRRKLWFKNVRILIQRHPKPNMQKLLSVMVHDVMHATLLVGPEYGLTHWTQPPTEVADHDDIWVEKNGNEAVSFITCRDTAPVPQCAHYVDALPFSLQIHYDAKLLPEWKKIEEHVLSLYGSFNTPETATAYFNENNNSKVDMEITDDHAEHDQPR